MGCPVVQEWPASADAGRCWLVSDSDTGLKKGTGGLHRSSDVAQGLSE